MHFLPYICFFFVDIVLLMIAVPNGKCKFISYNFLVMETSTVTQVNYSLKEKYFHVEPEMRMRRYQYFVRILIPGILYFLASMLILAPLAGLVLVAALAGWGKGAIIAVVIGSSIVGLLFDFLIYKI